MELLLITDKNKSHYVYIKDFSGLCVITQNVGLKNTFANRVSNVLVVEKY